MKARSLVWAGVHRVARAFRLRGPLAGDPTAEMFHVLLLVVAIWMAFWSLATLRLAAIVLERILYVVILEVSLTTALVVLRRGYLRSASLVYLAGIWIWATLALTYVGTIRSSPALVLYVILPVSAAWLLGYRAALWTSAVCIATMLFFTCLGMLGVMVPRPVPSTLLGTFAVAVQAILIGTIPVGQVIRRLQDTLKELQGYKQDLELLVDQRTAELVKARDEAQAANRSKDVFLANMSHELRTPLNAILGFSNLLREHDVSEQQRRDLDIINRSGEHLLTLINDVLDVAKIGAGRTELDIAPCDLGSLIDDVTGMIRSRASQKGLSLRVEAPPSTLFIRTDAARLRQVLLNLLNNAVKFTALGSVTLRVSAASAADPGEALLAFEIEDTGAGIATADQASIFEAFVQASSADRLDGAGLGLTISRQIIALMGGSIQVKSAPGQGSCFRTAIKVKLAQESEVVRGADSRRVTALAAGQPEYRILIVEDQQENWMVLQRLLQNCGFRVRVAQDGAQGVKEFDEWRPQFIWMDLRMPVMNGLEAARRIRSAEGGREVKIVAVTASGYASRRNEILASGFDDYVRKPYRPAEVFECMARHLGVRYRDTETIARATADGEIAREHVAALSIGLRRELGEAVISLDAARISAAIDRVAIENPALGLTLRRSAEGFAYSAILNAIPVSGVQSF